MIETDSQIYDILIIGAGVVGCSIARQLSKSLLSVVVVEKSNDASQGASKSNSGIVHSGYDDRFGSVKASLSHRGNQMFAQLDKELNFGFKRIGSLVLAFNDQDKNTLRELMENGAKNRVSGLELLDRNQVLKKEPHLSDDVVGALFCGHTGITSPYEYCISLAENAITNGVQFYLEHEVVDIIKVADDTFHSSSSSGSHFLVRTNRDGDAFTPCN
jgi:glycerol-3-phosphate dehydrogenase